MEHTGRTLVWTLRMSLLALLFIRSTGWVNILRVGIVVKA
jgi:hypothetical protein